MIKLNAEMSVLDLRPNDLLLCIDETGSESLSDPRHPVFGFGGCAIEGSRYIEAVEQPWNQLKLRHFGLTSQPLHAAKVSPSNLAGIDAIGNFFRTSPVARFAMLLTTETAISGEDTDTYQALALSFADQLGRVLQAFEYFRLVLAFEQSERGDPKVRQHFTQLHPILAGPSGPFRGPVERCFIPKSAAFPLMEVADFVIQAAGGQARAQLKPHFQLRPDFRAVFEPTSDRFAEVLFTDRIHVRRKNGGA
jgi:hypothetical protein